MFHPAAGQPKPPMPLALLVDRDDDTRQMYAEFLTRSSYEIAEAADGREGLAKAVSCPPSVVIMETHLPGISGLELCRLLRRDPLTQSVPLVVVTGDAMPGNLALAEAAGADVVLVKPCLPDRLLIEIEGVMSRSLSLRLRSAAIHERVVEELAEASRVVERARSSRQRLTLNRSHERRVTSDPPFPPPTPVCPTCDRTLKYVVSQVGGVSERFSEQWDYFECGRCQSAFEYRQRTRKLRLYSFQIPTEPSRRSLTRRGQRV